MHDALIGSSIPLYSLQFILAKTVHSLDKVDAPVYFNGKSIEGRLTWDPVYNCWNLD